MPADGGARNDSSQLEGPGRGGARSDTGNPSLVTFGSEPEPTLRWFEDMVGGDVCWFDFGAPRSAQYTIAGARPCVLLSNVPTIVGRTLVVSPLTGREHAITGYPYHVVVDHLYCIDRDALIDEHHIAVCSCSTMKRIMLQTVTALNVRLTQPAQPRLRQLWKLSAAPSRNQPSAPPSPAPAPPLDAPRSTRSAPEPT